MPEHSEDVILVGMSASLSGDFKIQGMQALHGVTSWIRDVNRQGGIFVEDKGARLPVSLVYYDDHSRLTSVRECVVKLIEEDKIDILIGPYSSSLSIAAADVANSHHKVLWNQRGSSDDIYEKGHKYVLGVLTSAEEYLSGLPEAVKTYIPDARTYAVITSNKGNFPRSVSSGACRSLDDNEFCNVLSQEYDPDNPQFDDVVNRVKECKPDILICVGRIETDIMIAKKIVDSKSKSAIKLCVFVAAGISRFAETLLVDADGFVGPVQWHKDVGYTVDVGPRNSEVIASLQETSQMPVDYPMVQAYSAGVVVKHIVEIAGSLNQNTLRDTAIHADFTTFFGRFKLDPSSGKPVEKSMSLVQWQNGYMELVWPEGLSSATLRPTCEF